MRVKKEVKQGQATDLMLFRNMHPYTYGNGALIIVKEKLCETLDTSQPQRSHVGYMAVGGEDHKCENTTCENGGHMSFTLLGGVMVNGMYLYELSITQNAFTVQVTFQHCRQRQFRFKCLAQGHFGLLTGESGDQTTDLSVCGRPLFPEPHPPEV